MALLLGKLVLGILLVAWAVAGIPVGDAGINANEVRYCTVGIGILYLLKSQKSGIFKFCLGMQELTDLSAAWHMFQGRSYLVLLGFAKLCGTKIILKKKSGVSCWQYASD